MSFLEKNWNKIKGDESKGTDHALSVAQCFLRPWNHEITNMESICKALRMLKPKIVIELGTFEAMGTEKMARALQANRRKATLYTIDAGAPVNTLGPLYGNEWEYDERGNAMPGLVPWEEFERKKKGDGYQQRAWGGWRQILKARTERLSQNYKPVRVKFIEGMTFDVLPDLLEKLGHFDFCFQDTVHEFDWIMREWEILEPYAKPGSIVVFDDILRDRNRSWGDWFIANVKGWVTKWETVGDEPFWVEKLEEQSSKEEGGEDGTSNG